MFRNLSSTHRSSASHRLVLALSIVCLVVACAPPGQQGGQVGEEEREEIRQLLEAYLPAVGQAYAERDASLVGEWAVPKEVARIELRIEELEAKGQVYEPEFQSLEIEGISTWNYANAFVTTLEAWDVSSYTLGTRQLVNQVEDQRSRVKYQLKRDGDGWVVLYRELAETLDG